MQMIWGRHKLFLFPCSGKALINGVIPPLNAVFYSAYPIIRVIKREAYKTVKCESDSRTRLLYQIKEKKCNLLKMTNLSMRAYALVLHAMKYL